MKTDIIAVPGLNDEFIFLPTLGRPLFDEESTNVSEVINNFHVIGPAFIPVDGTELLISLNWPFQVYRWDRYDDIAVR